MDKLTVSSSDLTVTSSYHVLTPTARDPRLELENDDHEFHFEIFLWRYISPIIFICGVCGNMLVLAVMRRKKLQGSTSSIYLPLLAVADTAALVTGIIPEWMEACGWVTFKEIHPWTCKFEKFSFYTSSDVAIWILVAFTFDRFIAVVFPLKKRLVCVPKRALIGSLGILIAAVVKNIHVFWTRGPQYDENGEFEKNCGAPSVYKYFESYVRPWIAFTLVSLIPICIIFVCNCCIIRRLVKTAKMHTERTFTQTTLMCLSASFTFLLCITPSIVLLIGKPYWTSSDTVNNAYIQAKAVNNQLVFINHSINFVLYCLTGQRFRSELVAMLRGHTEDRSTKSVSTTPYSSKKKSVQRKFSLDANSILGNGTDQDTPDNGLSQNKKEIQEQVSNGAESKIAVNGPDRPIASKNLDPDTKDLEPVTLVGIKMSTVGGSEPRETLEVRETSA